MTKKLILIFAFIFSLQGFSQKEYLGDGPFSQLIIRGVTLINGDGSPPRGPMDIVVENNKIVTMQIVGYPGVKINEKRRPKLKRGGKELDANGMYLLPGFIDMHGHIGGASQGANPDYVFRLWMAHGITSVRQPSGRNAIELKRQSAANKIVAPRIFEYTGFGSGSKKPITTPEALFNNRTVQNYPLDYNYQNEQHRFEEAGKLWKQAAKPYSEHWNKVMDELLSLDFTLDPTFNIYEASRDLQRARRAEWHEDYTLPSLWKFYEPSKISHGSYWHYWGTEQEVQWKQNFKLWMTFVNEYKNRGGRVTVGTDSGFIYQLYGFAYARELELLREAGFHPLEVIRAATLNGAEALGWEDKIGSVQIGKLADFVIVEENPLVNLKVLYGTGAIKLTKDNEVVRVGGVKYTIKDGIIYDAKRLLAEVKAMVDKEKAKTNWKLKQPGIKK